MIIIINRERYYNGLPVQVEKLRDPQKCVVLLWFEKVQGMILTLVIIKTPVLSSAANNPESEHKAAYV